MSKYNDFMSHIRVDDEMHRRIMNAVSEAIEQQGEQTNEGAKVQPLNANVNVESKVKTPIKRKAKISLITGLSIAAAAFLVVGGAVLFATRFMRMTKSATPMYNAQATQACETAMDERTEEIDGVLSGNRTLTANSDKKKVDSSVKIKTPGSTENSAESENRAVKTAGEDGSDDHEYAPAGVNSAIYGKKITAIQNVLPFKVKNVGTGTLNDNSITTTVFDGTNGEKIILFSAKAGTDILKAYYPDFKGIPAQLQTEAGQAFNGIDITVGNNEQVKLSGPFDAVTWTKGENSYMLLFNTKTDVQVFISIMEKI